MCDEIDPGQYREFNYLPEDEDWFDKTFGGVRLIVVDDATPKAIEAAVALTPYMDDFTEEELIKRVLELYKDDWVFLLTPYGEAYLWRALLGNAMYKQMGGFRLFIGKTSGEARKVHFFMIKKTPTFKKHLKKFKVGIGGPIDNDRIKRISMIMCDGGEQINLLTADPTKALKTMLE
jgi:hypothetical protein